ncbi:group 1 truncated hemoglobin [Halostagnicola sp. A-GB9-2]|uniref:group I truncated hemoglobin n=1 Tax=Halostagnicola sp. A-GB9-2 TaxID=3048066 RepID=UPI0024C045A3|nr:group 1 truncated hemoglobin [Halostagnicola sp. A-GB9-2]MDJ1432909.1 group 1 truncated hemoglobin [Halostagnicola sp. A-GB9-2]
MAEQTLYDRLGGEEAIGAVVDQFYEYVLADDDLVGYFEDVDMQAQRAHQTQFLSSVAGGPVEYTGEDMETAHDHLGISQKDFDVIAQYLGETLAEFDVDEADRKAVLEAVGQYEDAIVTAD